MKRTVFAYPYVIFAIVFLLAPLLLIFFYSITQPINPISISPHEEISQDSFIENLKYIGYDEDINLSSRGTFYSKDNTVTVYNNKLNNDEWYNISFADGEVLNIDEIDEEGQTIDIITSLRLETVISGFIFTLRHFIRFFQSKIYINVLLRSLKIAFISTILCLLLGFPAAYILSKMDDAKRNFASMLFILPMWMNFLLRTYAWRTLLEKNGVINQVLAFFNLPQQEMMYSQSAVILCMVYNFLPFMILPIYNTLCRIDSSILEASHDLGANHYSTLFKVVLPLSFPGIASGITMTFIPSVTAFAISKILGGTESTMIGEVIEREFNYNYWFGSAISVIIMVLLIVSMTFLSRYEKDESVGGGLI